VPPWTADVDTTTTAKGLAFAQAFGSAFSDTSEQYDSSPAYLVTVG